MRDLIILGDGVHGAEMAEIVERINRQTPTWNLLGYLSAHETPPDSSRNGYPVLGSWASRDKYPDTAFIPDNEWPKSLLIPHERLITLIDPGTFVSRTARIGKGCVFYPNCFIGLNTRIGDFTFCLSGSIINHDDTLEERVILASGVTLAGSIYVESGCYMGQSCTVRQHLRIGRNSTIGMGAVVVKDVPPDSVIVGNPGKPLRK